MKLKGVLLSSLILTPVTLFAQDEREAGQQSQSIMPISSSSGLTAQEMQELTNAFLSVSKSDPNLAEEGKNLRSQMEKSINAGVPPSPQLVSEHKLYQEHLMAAILKADPKIADILKKLQR